MKICLILTFATKLLKALKNLTINMHIANHTFTFFLKGQYIGSDPKPLQGSETLNAKMSMLESLWYPEAEFKEFEPRLKFKPRLKYGWFH